MFYFELCCSPIPSSNQSSHNSVKSLRNTSITLIVLAIFPVLAGIGVLFINPPLNPTTLSAAVGLASIGLVLFSLGGVGVVCSCIKHILSHSTILENEDPKSVKAVSTEENRSQPSSINHSSQAQSFSGNNQSKKTVRELQDQLLGKTLEKRADVKKWNDLSPKRIFDGQLFEYDNYTQVLFAYNSLYTKISEIEMRTGYKKPKLSDLEIRKSCDGIIEYFNIEIYNKGLFSYPIFTSDGSFLGDRCVEDHKNAKETEALVVQSSRLLADFLCQCYPDLNDPPPIFNKFYSTPGISSLCYAWQQKLNPPESSQGDIVDSVQNFTF